MKRLTMSLDDELADAFDRIVRDRGYVNRSEAFRDLLRADLGQAHQAEHPDGPCVATLSYVYDHHQRQLASRLTDLQHDHHELTVSTLHAHLGHEHCIEVAILRGQTEPVRRFAQAIITQPGVSHGELHIMPLQVHHAHGHDHHHLAVSARSPVDRATPSRPARKPGTRGD